VIAVGDAQVVAAVGTLRDDQVGPPAADLAADVAAEIARVLQLAVRIAQELHALDAEGAGRVALLLLADVARRSGAMDRIARTRRRW
jgi:hypothetical protein